MFSFFKGHYIANIECKQQDKSSIKITTLFVQILARRKFGEIGNFGLILANLYFSSPIAKLNPRQIFFFHRQIKSMKNSTTTHACIVTAIIVIVCLLLLRQIKSKSNFNDFRLRKIKSTPKFVRIRYYV